MPASRVEGLAEQVPQQLSVRLPVVNELSKNIAQLRYRVNK